MKIIRPTDEFQTSNDMADLGEFESLSKEELREKAKSEFHISNKEWEDKINVEPMFSSETVDDISNLNKYFAERLEKKLSGKIMIRTSKNEERWVQQGKAMCGTLLINSCVGIIETFANKSMLISSKRDEDFNMQFEDAFTKISDLIMMPQTYIDVNNIRTVLKQFKDTFWNLGSILTKTSKNMDAYFAALGKASDNADLKIKSRYGE